MFERRKIPFLIVFNIPALINADAYGEDDAQLAASVVDAYADTPISNRTGNDCSSDQHLLLTETKVIDHHIDTPAQSACTAVGNERFHNPNTTKKLVKGSRRQRNKSLHKKNYDNSKQVVQHPPTVINTPFGSRRLEIIRYFLHVQQDRKGCSHYRVNGHNLNRKNPGYKQTLEGKWL
eukprot:gene5709-8996_t